jgi:hypothetical protein
MGEDGGGINARFFVVSDPLFYNNPLSSCRLR